MRVHRGEQQVGLGTDVDEQIRKPRMVHLVEQNPTARGDLIEGRAASEGRQRALQRREGGAMIGSDLTR